MASRFVEGSPCRNFPYDRRAVLHLDTLAHSPKAGPTQSLVILPGKDAPKAINVITDN